MPIDNESTPNTSRRESLAAAMATLENGDGEHVETEAPLTEAEGVEAAPVEVEAEAVETPEAKDAGRDEHGRFKPKAEEPEAKAKPAEKPIPAAQEGKPTEAEARPALPAGAPKPPGRWRPAIREKWATIDPEVRDEVWRQERGWASRLDVAEKAAQAAQESIKAAGVYRDAIAPFENTIRQRGAEPQAFVSSLLQTEHALSTAQPAHRADLLARLVVQYGRDVLQPDRKDEQGNLSSPLDRALVAMMSGRAPAQPQQQAQQNPAQFRDPRLDALIEQGKRREAEAQTQAAAQADDAASSFSETHEFYEDVHEAVADILDVWAKRGKREVTPEELERAYNLACQDNPDVAPIYAQRQAAEAAKKAKAVNAKSRAASTGIRPAPVVAVAQVSGKPLTRRESMRAAMEAQEEQGRV